MTVVQAKCTAAVTGQHRSERARVLCPACTPQPRAAAGVGGIAAAVPVLPTSSWPAQKLRDRRGHDFYPPSGDVPPLYATEDTPLADKVIVARYFLANSEWWVVEADSATGEAFGYACLAGDDMNAEWGYMSLPELEGLQVGPLNRLVERDLHWTPKTAKEANLPGLRI